MVNAWVSNPSDRKLTCQEGFFFLWSLVKHQPSQCKHIRRRENIVVSWRRLSIIDTSTKSLTKVKHPVKEHPRPVHAPFHLLSWSQTPLLSLPLLPASPSVFSHQHHPTDNPHILPHPISHHFLIHYPFGSSVYSLRLPPPQSPSDPFLSTPSNPGCQLLVSPPWFLTKTSSKSSLNVLTWHSIFNQLAYPPLWLKLNSLMSLVEFWFPNSIDIFSFILMGLQTASDIIDHIWKRFSTSSVSTAPSAFPFFFSILQSQPAAPQFCAGSH